MLPLPFKDAKSADSVRLYGRCKLWAPYWCQQWNHVFNHLLITSFLFSVTDVFFVIEILVGSFQLSITSSWSRCSTFVLEDWSIQVLAQKYNPIPRETMRGLHNQMWFVRRRLFRSNAFGKVGGLDLIKRGSKFVRMKNNNFSVLSREHWS